MPAPRKSLNNKRWRKFRELRLAADPLCQFCLEQGRGTEATEVDHIGDPDLHTFENTRCLCKPCHSSRTWHQMRGKEIRRTDTNGFPSDWD